MSERWQRLAALWAVPVALSVATLGGVVYAIDPVGSDPGLASGPGITIDEPFNVQQGVRLAVAVPEWIRGGLTLREVFGEPDDVGPNAPVGYHLADHPPLGRAWLGVSHQLGRVLLPPANAGQPFVTASARLGSALAFALTVLLVGRVASGWYGWRAGAVAAAALVLMPRCWGHAHVASLETVLNLFWTAAVVHVAGRWSGEEGVTPRTAAVSGLLLGLLLLTKIQAVLLVPPFLAWALWNWRQRALLPLAVCGSTAFAVFFVGWPWLWLDPAGHLVEYFARTTERASLRVTYFGTVFADRDVPWHYPFVMFLLTVPIGLQALGVAGNVVRRTGDQESEASAGIVWRREQFLLAVTVFPLALFAVPGVVVYDGVRLFLVVFPIWAVLIGRGAARLLETLDARLTARWSTTLVATFVALQGYAIVVLCPCHLSYYNLFVGGTAGAERLGLQTTYWGEPITRELLATAAEQAGPGGAVHVVPALHPLYPAFLESQTPAFQAQGVRVVDFNGSNPTESRLVLVHHRTADWPDGLAETLVSAERLSEVRRGGVLLAELVRLPPQAAAE